MNKKKILIGILLVASVVLVLWLITFGIDYYRCVHFKAPIFTTSSMILESGYENKAESRVDYCLGYHVAYLTTINLENNCREIERLSMYLFGKCILNV